MKLFEMSNSYTQKTRSMWFFYIDIGIALLLKSWIVYAFTFEFEKHALYWILYHLQLRTVLSNKPEDSVIGFSRQDYLSGGWCCWILVCWFLHFIDYICCLDCLYMCIQQRVFPFAFIFCLLSWRPYGLFLFITLVSLWLCNLLTLLFDHLGEILALFVHHLGQLMACPNSPVQGPVLPQRPFPMNTTRHQKRWTRRIDILV